MSELSISFLKDCLQPLVAILCSLQLVLQLLEGCPCLGYSTPLCLGEPPQLGDLQILPSQELICMLRRSFLLLFYRFSPDESPFCCKARMLKLKLLCLAEGSLCLVRVLCSFQLVYELLLPSCEVCCLFRTWPVSGGHHIQEVGDTACPHRVKT